MSRHGLLEMFFCIDVTSWHNFLILEYYVRPLIVLAVLIPAVGRFV